MRLRFNLLVVDDTESSASAAIRSLEEHLGAKGFKLEVTLAPDLTDAGMKALTRNLGRDYDLVIIDYGLGTDIDGSIAALYMRRGMPYTDIIFFSSTPRSELISKLAEQRVDGVFVSDRNSLSETLIGVTDTIIGKAVDLSHMRGIAIAEVAEIDVLLEEILLRVCALEPEIFDGFNDHLIRAVSESSARHGDRLAPLISEKRVLDIVGNPTLFSSFQKYQAVRTLAKALPNPPTRELVALAPYQSEVIENRNTLAHAMERVGEDGSLTLRSAIAGAAEVTIDEEWMVAFRTKLRGHREALNILCDQISTHVSSIESDRRVS